MAPYFRAKFGHRSFDESWGVLNFENFGGVALFRDHPLVAPAGGKFLRYPLEGDEL